MSLRKPAVPTMMGAVVLGVWIPLAWPVKIKAHFNQSMEGSVLGVQLQNQMLNKGHPDQLIRLVLVHRYWEGPLLFVLFVILPHMGKLGSFWIYYVVKDFTKKMTFTRSPLTAPGKGGLESVNQLWRQMGNSQSLQASQFTWWPSWK